jgi:hypothetical protein
MLSSGHAYYINTPCTDTTRTTPAPPPRDGNHSFALSSARMAVGTIQFGEGGEDDMGIDIYLASKRGACQFILDSGASEHLVPDLNTLWDYVPFTVPQPLVTAGKGSNIAALGYGTLVLDTTVDGKACRRQLPRTLYVPDATTSLISVPVLVQRHLNTTCVLTSKGAKVIKDGRTLFTADYRNNCVSLNVTPVYRPIHQAMSISPLPLATWHLRLNHLN